VANPVTDMGDLDRLLDQYPDAPHSALPWRWEVNRAHHHVTICGGSPRYDATVMDFVRWGMSGAAPRFMTSPSVEPFRGGDMQRCDEMAVPFKGAEHHADWKATIENPDADYLLLAANAYPGLRALVSELVRQNKALSESLMKINVIRNSIVGLQTVNWSEHIYPLVAALNEAGQVGMEYPEAREQFGTMLDRTNAAEAKVVALTEERDEARGCAESYRNAVHATTGGENNPVSLALPWETPFGESVVGPSGATGEEG
jgi:hypothetical protein